uniref:Putative ovule protein n=1 Tax=Solanum chacoense TaxID=4108 RepID=A0A0V0HL27_SOLCH
MLFQVLLDGVTANSVVTPLFRKLVLYLVTSFMNCPAAPRHDLLSTQKVCTIATYTRSATPKKEC